MPTVAYEKILNPGTYMVL